MQVGYETLVFLTSISRASLHVVSTVTIRCNKYALPDCGKMMILIAGSSKQQSLLIDGYERWSVYDKKPQRYAEDNSI